MLMAAVIFFGFYFLLCLLAEPGFEPFAGFCAGGLGDTLEAVVVFFGILLGICALAVVIWAVCETCREERKNR